MKSWLEKFLTHRPLLFRVISRIVRPDEIEDIVQETFLHSYAAARNTRISNPRAFMVTVAKNIALNHNNRAENRLNCSMNDLIDPDILTLADSAEMQCQSDERFLIFCKAVAGLPVNCRRVFILKKVYGLSQKEIASHLKISPSTVEKHVAKGMQKTAQYMEEKGLLVGAKAVPERKLTADLDVS